MEDTIPEGPRNSMLSADNRANKYQIVGDLLENINDLIYRYEFYPKRRFAYVSPASTKITGYTPQDHYNDPDLGMKLIHPDDRELLEKASSNGYDPDKKLILRWVKKDGSIIWTEQYIKYHYGKDGQIVALDGVARDVTRERKAREEIENERELNDLLLENTSVGIAILNANFEILKANKTFNNYVAHYTKGLPDKPDNKNLFSLISEKTEEIRESLREVVSEKQSLHFDNYRYSSLKNGQRVNTYWDVSIAPVKQPNHQNASLLITVKDVTDLLQTEKALLETKGHYRTLIDLSPDAIAISDLKGNILLSNRQALAYHGFSSFDEYRKSGLKLLDLIHPDDRTEARKNLKIVLEKGILKNIQYRLLRSDGSSYIGEISASLLKDTRGKPKAYIGVIRDITQRRIGEAKIKASEELFSTAFRKSPMLMSISTIKEGRYLEVNETFQKITGYTRKDLIGNLSVDTGLIKKSDRRKMFRLLQEKGEIHALELRLKKKNGETFWCRYHGQIITIEGKKRLLSIAEDVNEQKLAKTALENSESKFRQIFENAADAILLVDKKAILVDVNPAFTKITGIEREKVIGKSGFELAAKFANKDTIKELYKIIKSHISGQPVANMEIPYKGKILEINTSIFGTNRFSIGIIRDVTQNIKFERKIRDSERRLKEAEAIGRIGHVDWDVEKQRAIWTDEIFSIYERDKQLGEPGFDEIMALHQPDDAKRLESAVREALQKDIPYELELQTSVLPSGKVKHLHIIGKPIKNKKGKVIHLRGIVQDVTERKEYEKALLVAKDKAEQSDRLKSAFLANISHEIRTPMNSILGFAQLLEQENNSPKEQQEYIQLIHASGNRMLNLINDIIDISKIESGIDKAIITEVNINALLKDVYNYFKIEAQTKGLDFLYQYSLSDDNATVRTDRNKLLTIFSNLIKNAIKFTNHGRVEFGFEVKGGQFECFVSDTGIGIPEDKQQLIFERFVQADEDYQDFYEGAGLGLAITKAYVSLLGGEISLRSKPGEGTTFYFTINHIDEPATDIRRGVLSL